jgi:replicative DNA helicase
MNDQLNSDFIEELFKACLRSRTVLEVCLEHLDERYLADDAERNVWNAIANHYNVTGNCPTLGILAQEFAIKTEEKSFLSRIKQAEIQSNDDLLSTLEDFIRRATFVLEYEKVGITYNKGDRDAAYLQWEEVSQRMQNFSLKAKSFSKVFKGYEEREEIRQLNAQTNNGGQRKYPFSIDELDALTKGGMSPGDTACFLALSGVGKSKVLKWVGLGLARRGYRVLHIQGEGTKDECEALYDAGWTGSLLHDIELGNIDDAKRKKIKKTIANIEGEIFIQAFEQFDTASFTDIRKAVIDCEKANGKIDFLLVDYLELFDPGDGKKYGPAQERERRLACGNKFKNICVEFQLGGATATQGSDVSREMLNKPEFYLTRNNISEVKNLPNAFSFFITLNQTDDEYEESIMRLYTDKIRKYKGKKLIYIYQNYERERFYDRKRTIANYFSGGDPANDLGDD